MKFFGTKTKSDNVSRPAKQERRIAAEKPERSVSVSEPAVRHSGVSQYGVIRRFHVTEKSSALAGKNAYVCIVSPDANKHMVKRAIASRYGVTVVAVRIINTPEKMRRRGMQVGWKQGLKKAVVTLKEGDTIEVQ